LVLAGELGMRPLVADCHLGLGRLVEARRLDMRFWLEQAEAVAMERGA
jgi:hypothetical protein